MGIQRVTFGCPLRGMWIPRSGHPMGILWLPPMSHQWASLSGHVTRSGHLLVTTHPDRAAPPAALARPFLAAHSPGRCWPPSRLAVAGRLLHMAAALNWPLFSVAAAMMGFVQWPPPLAWPPPSVWPIRRPQLLDCYTSQSKLAAMLVAASTLFRARLIH